MEKQKTEAQAMIPAPIVTPAVTPEEALQAWKKYEALKAKIVTENDVQKIQGKDFLKKSYWRKIATFFNLSLECVAEERVLSGEVVIYSLTYKAIAPNGRFSYGDGACASDEKGLDKTEHNTRAIAHTRAFNRAVSNLVGGGEVSAEEMPVESSPSTKKQSPEPQEPHGIIGDIIPFGKYKGQTLEQIYEVNSQYFNWLLRQNWFKEDKWDELRDKVEMFLDDRRPPEEISDDPESAPY